MKCFLQNKITMVSILIIFSLLSKNSFAQTCCLTDSLIINTGYDPVGDTAITPTCDGCTPLPDPKWTVSYIAPDLMAAILTSTYIPTPISTHADVIPGYSPWWDSIPGCGWISCMNARGFPIVFDSGNFKCIFQRKFTVVCTTCVNFNLKIAGDNWVQDISVSGIGSIFGPEDSTVNNWADSVVTVTGCTTLPPGSYTISVTLHNGQSASPSNPMGLMICGSVITSPLRALLNENSVCCSNYKCTIPPIIGSTKLCVGATDTLADSASCGSWTSTNTTIATVGSTSGVVTGVHAGTSIISYTDNCGRVVTDTITVNPAPSIITGKSKVCQGSTISLSDSLAGGTWSSSNTAVGTISTTGVVGGISGGTAIITYAMPTGCFATSTITVNPNAVITGLSTLCAGDTTTLFDSTSGGLWSSGNNAVGTIISATGLFTGISAGTTIITYTLPTGCSRTFTVTINPLPNPISGKLHECEDSTTTLIDLGGGTWSSGYTAVATVGAGSGVVTGVSGGTTMITYTLPTGCFITAEDTVYPTGLIIGARSVCIGFADTLSETMGTGTWSSSNTGVATIGSVSGIIGSVSVGTTIITYTFPDGCKTSISFTVNPLPPAIHGPTVVCQGSTITLTNSGGAGSWSSSNTAVATVGIGSGVVSGLSAGTVIITYTLTTGCYATITESVIPAAEISGDPILCLGYTYDFTDATPGGTWSSSNVAVGTVGSVSGIVGGVSVGAVTITYSIASTGCYRTFAMSVWTGAGPIYNNGPLCTGGILTLVDSSGSGTWTSSNTGVATIGSSSGIVTGVSAGTTIITYLWGFYTYLPCSIKTITVTVSPLPAAITGTTTLCVNASSTLSDDSLGGSWSSGNTSIATIGAGTGLLTGVSAGTAIITYAMPGAGCVVTKTVTILPLPAGITGSLSVCIGLTSTLHDASGGGSWASSNTAVATIGSITGVVNGLTLGTSIITYTISTGCYATAIVTVNPLPSLITGTTTKCKGLPTFLYDSTSGGTWSSSNPTIAYIGSSTGLVIGLLSGTSIITYTLPTGCYITTTVTIDPEPGVITGITTLCPGITSLLSDTTASGTWSSSSTWVATVGSGTGIVTGISTGTATITYLLATGCYTTTTITVSLPPVITGLTSVCVGSTTTLSDSTGGGTWASSNSTIATVGSLTGVVTGLIAGTAIITYQLPTGCFTTTSITVNPLPAPITGSMVVCVGTSDTLSDLSTVGTWSSSNIAVGVIDWSTGIFTGVSTGTTIISYILNNSGCYITATITVISTLSPPPIIGLSPLCAGLSTTFTDGMSGGTWTSSNTTVATIGLSTGIVTGVTNGTAIISYTVTNLCGSTTTTSSITIVGLGIIPGITGPIGVCSGTTDTLSDAAAGGTWISSNTAIATVGIGTGIVTGVTSGTVTISYTVTGACGTIVAVRKVIVNMPPFITANSIVACQSAAGGEFGSGYMLPDTTCLLVCDSTTVRYYGNGNAGSVFTWVVAGGIIVNNYGDSIDVFWPLTGTTASITIYDTVSHCTGSDSVCIMVIKKPHAAFGISADSICLGDNISFTDESTNDMFTTVSSWYWDFGDGNYSSVENPVHTFTVPNSHDTVTLVVKNGCGCSDTFRTVIYIAPVPGPVIQCPSIVCDSEFATYSAPGTCAMNNWSVTGGTIVSGMGTTSITVVWDSASPSGFGYVNLSEPCGCPYATTIKIPVILKNAVITGPDTICVGQQYNYTLPLWPGTQYMWGVLSDPGAILGVRDDYKVTVEFSTPGTYTLHGWYQNRIKLCGGNEFKTITVVAPDTIIGNRLVCANSTDTFRLSDTTLSANWTLTNITGSVVRTGTGTLFAPALDSGLYVLFASGNFCANPITIQTTPIPGTVDSMTGPDTVCLGRVYNYYAFNDVPGSTYIWQATGGTVSPVSGSSHVNVTWTGGGTMQLSVSRVSTSPPYCQGLPTVLNVSEEIINPNITGDSLPCANSTHTYNSNYSRGEDYDWTLIPPTAGSIISGNHTPVIHVQWNNVPVITAVSIVAAVHKCDSVVTDTLGVNVLPLAPPAITSSDTVICPNTIVTFSTIPGDSEYVWSFGDGSGILMTTLTSVQHMFPKNTTSGNVSYNVRLTGIPPTSILCQPAGTSTIEMTILPGPLVNVSTIHPGLCLALGADSSLLVGSITSGLTGTTYQWYSNGIAISGATNVNYETLDTSSDFYLVATATNGCSDTSNGIAIGYGCAGGTFCDKTVSSTVGCNKIYLFGVLGGVGWTANTLPVGGPLPPGPSAIATYDMPGIYGFSYFYTSADCPNIPMFDTIGIIPAFRYMITCGSGGSDSIYLYDYSNYLSFWSPPVVTWTDLTTGAGIPAGSNVAITRPASRSYQIRETVTGTRPGGTYACDTIMTIYLPAPPVAAFTDTLSPICEGVPIQFTSTSTGGILQYSWNFGDGALSLLQNPLRSYLWPRLPNPYPDTVTLTVTDTIGCKDSITHIVNIYDNTLAGIYSGGGTVCSDAVPFIEMFAISLGAGTPPYRYLWSNGGTTSTINIYQSGAYWVTVYDTNQCQQSFFSAQNVKVLQTPVAIIKGRQRYCYGEVVHLTGYDGPGVVYQWLRNGVSDGIGYEINDPGLSPRDYYYQLVLGSIDSASGTICYDTSAIDTVHVFPIPAVPAITGPSIVDCSLYHLQLIATESDSGTYNWSNGVYGAVNDIYTGGPYRVWFTNSYGCTNSNDTIVPLSVDTWFPYLPNGCYPICQQQLPLTLYGIPGVAFSYWGWLKNTVPVESGTGLMSPYTINSAGAYQWSLFNGLCPLTSPDMNVTTMNCYCQDSFTVNIICDTGNPASYEVIISLNSPSSGTAYTLGTTIGPIDPFSGTLSSAGPQPPMTLTFTTLTLPAPSTVTVEVSYTLPDGSKCFQKETVPLPPCSWIAERLGNSVADSSNSKGINLQSLINSALLVFPNPASGEVTISYDYGTESYKERSLEIYDLMGRKIEKIAPQDVHGKWILNAKNWGSGLYIIRMEADGSVLQTQRLVVPH